MTRRTTAYSLLALPAVQIGILLWLIWTRTPHVPWQDEWELANFLELADRGQLQLAAFWSFQNEHRIFLPRLILFALIQLTAWNRQVLMTVNLAVACAAVALLLHGMRRTVGARGYLLLFVPTCLLLFSFGHYGNWLFAFQLNFILALLGIACCLWALLPASPAHAGTSRRWWLAFVGAAVASLSTLAGLVTWFAFFPAIWRHGWRARAAWCLAAIAIIVPYSIGFPRSATGLASLRALADYTLVCLGAPLGGDSVPLARAWGALGLLLMAALLITHRHRWNGWLEGWGCLALQALGTALLTALGRATLGVDEALMSRYRLFSVLWWVALLVVAARTLPLARRVTGRRVADSAGLALALPLLLGLGGANVQGFADGWAWQEYFRLREGCVLDYPTASDECLVQFYASAPIARIHAAFLEQHQLAGFRQAATPVPAGLPATAAIQASIDTVAGIDVGDGPITVSPDAPIVIQGWAADATARTPGAAVYVLIDGHDTYRAEPGDERSDVATATGIAAYRKAGFTATLPAGMLTDGEHTLAIEVVSADARAYGLASPRVIITIRAGRSS